MQRRGVRSLLCLTAAVWLAIGHAAAQSDSGRVVDVPQKSKDELIFLLQSLQLAPRTPEERQRLLDLYQNMSPEQKQRVQDFATKLQGQQGQSGQGAGSTQIPKGGMPQVPGGQPPVDATPRPGPERVRAGEQESPRNPGGTDVDPAPIPQGTVPPQAGRADPARLGLDGRALNRDGSFRPAGGGPGRDKLEDRLRERPDIQRMIGFWEKNVGPLDRTPALKQVVLDIIRSAEQSKQYGEAGEGGLLSFLENQGGEVAAPGRWDWIDKAFEGSSMKFSDLAPKGWGPNLGGFNSDWKTPSAPAASFPGGFGGPSWEGSFSLILLLIVIGAAALIVWRYWPVLTRRSAAPTSAQKPWPVDPRSVADREGLIRAFEYLSVHLCGDAAGLESSNHRRGLANADLWADLVSDELAELYEVARYTPPSEVLSPIAISSARRCLCHLAGVSPA